MRLMLWVLSFSALALAACSRKEAGRSEAAGDHGKMAGSDTMRMGSIPLMDAMRAHMDSMAPMSPEQMRGMMAGHDGQMSQMLDAMGADMRSMNMAGDSAWTALTDSVKRDLAELPAMPDRELAAQWRAHAERVRRLIDLHQGMMKGM